RLERAAAADEPAASPAHRRILTEERTHWELRRFRKVVAASVADLDNDELEGWKEGEDAVVRALADAPRVWMHRDLHARNVLVNGERSVWIDYQDAMLGPWLYDAVSLLFDPYAALSPARRERLRRHYLAVSTPPDRETIDDDALWWLCAVQRLVHCVACYVYVCEHNDNSAYLKYLPYAIEQLREAFERCSLAAPLGQIMASRWTLLADRWCRHGTT
ncbi:MAG TPA: hypothetical protein DCZ72_09765, partial [Armatimonadetes bacterium]|nr:hypothetical protein [Armatimonadota bacterium]